MHCSTGHTQREGVHLVKGLHLHVADRASILMAGARRETFGELIRDKLMLNGLFLSCGPEDV